MKAKQEKILIFLISVTTIIFITLLFTFPTLWLWNWLMPVIFKLPEITIWQAFGITLLSRILFSSPNSK